AAVGGRPGTVLRRRAGAPGARPALAERARRPAGGAAPAGRRPGHAAGGPAHRGRVAPPPGPNDRRGGWGTGADGGVRGRSAAARAPATAGTARRPTVRGPCLPTSAWTG